MYAYDDEHALKGVWSSCELKEAIQHGYKLIKCFEIWEYEVETGRFERDKRKKLTMYSEILEMRAKEENNFIKRNEKGKQKNKTKKKAKKIIQKSVGLFTDYQNAFIRLKTEASGFPSSCKNERQKQQYIIDFYNDTGIILRYEYIKYNECKRYIAKLFLNSLYGKLIQTEKNMTTTILNNENDLAFYLNSDIHDIVDIFCPNDSYAVLQWKYHQDSDQSSVNIGEKCMKNVCITSGIQTTATGRLKLNAELQKLCNRLIYIDTDSAIFTSSAKDTYMPQLSPSIGGFTNELLSFRSKTNPNFEPTIVEICILAPKTYAMKIQVDVDEFKYITKCKGFQLTGKTASIVNMNAMKSFIFGKDFTDNIENHLDDKNENRKHQTCNKEQIGYFYTDKLKTSNEKITLLKNFKIVSKQVQKNFQFTFDKRIVGENFITYPYGYRNNV